MVLITMNYISLLFLLINDIRCNLLKKKVTDNYKNILIYKNINYLLQNSIQEDNTFRASRLLSSIDIAVPFITADSFTCFRFAILDDTGRNGLGHRWFDVALVLEFAAELNASAIIQSDHWEADGKHGNYTWFPDFAGIQDFTDASVTNGFIDGLSPITDNEWDIKSPKSYSHSCNVVIHSCDHCCSLTMRGQLSWCLKRYFPNALSRLAEYARPKFEATPWGKVHRHATATSCLSIFVHIRNGDILYGCGEHNRTSGVQIIVDLLNNVIETDCTVITFVAEGELSPECEKGMEQVRASVTLKNTEIKHQIGDHPAATLWNMVTSDILIGSGSSFPIIAATLSQWLVYIAPLPKEGNYNFSTLHDEVRYVLPQGFGRPDPTDSRQTIFPSYYDIGKYICDKVNNRRSKSNLCQSKQKYII